MKQETVPVLSIAIHAIAFREAVARILAWVADGKRGYALLCTTHTALECLDRPPMAEIARKADLVLPDGMPLVWIARRAGLPAERVYGPDLMLAVCEAGLFRNLRHCLYGATPDTLVRLASNLTERFPGLRIVESIAPPFRELTEPEKQAMADRINDAKPDIVWVGLGTPKQDFWVGEFRKRLNAAALIPVGAAFDFHAGRVRQAPRWMMRAGLEWLFRLAMEPRRLWKRYLIGNPRFCLLWLKQTLRQGSAAGNSRDGARPSSK